MSKKLIAVAVASVVAAPAAYADITAYGRIQNAIVMTDDGTNETQNVNAVGSRFGFKGSGDIGNGMSAFARYEWQNHTDADKGGPFRNRLSFVGLSGPFGSISLGQQWSAYYQNVGTYASPNINSGPGQQLGPFRTGNTLQYANSLGPVSFKADVRIQDDARSEEYGVNKKTGMVEKMMVGEGEGNGFGIGATLTAMDNVTLSGAYDSDDASGDKTVGVAATAGFGGLHFILQYEQQDNDDNNVESTNTVVGLSAGVTDQLTLSAAFGNTETETGGQTTAETDRVNAYATYRLGGGLWAWAEFANTDTGTSDTDVFALGLQMDF